MAPLVGYLALTRKSNGNAKASHEVTQCSPTDLKGMVGHLPTLVIDSLPSYLEIHRPFDQCISSYCDNSTIFKARGRIDSSSLYTKPDNDIIMTLRALWTNLPLRLASLNFRGYQDEKCDCNLLSRPAHLNVLADHLATDALMDLLQLQLLLSSLRCPPAESMLVMETVISQAMKDARSQPNSLSSNCGHTFNSATIGPTASMIPSTRLPTDQPILTENVWTFVIHL
jgi:hypothetical protein